MNFFLKKLKEQNPKLGKESTEIREHVNRTEAKEKRRAGDVTVTQEVQQKMGS